MPWRFGNSQLIREVNHKLLTERGTYSKSTPSRLCLLTRLVMAFTNAVLLAAVPKVVEKNREPAHFKRLFYDQSSKHDVHSVTHTPD